MKNINWWNVAAVALLANAFIGLCMAIALNTGYLAWAFANMVAFLILRLETLYFSLNESKKEYEPECNPYD